MAGKTCIYIASHSNYLPQTGNFTFRTCHIAQMYTHTHTYRGAHAD